MSQKETGVRLKRSLSSSVGESNLLHKTVDGDTNDMQTIAHLRYRLAGFLILQSLYASVMNRNKQLETENAKLNRLASQQENPKTQTKAHAASSGGDASASSQQEEGSNPNSLFCVMCRTMQETITRYEHEMASIKTSRRIIQQYGEREESREQQLRVREEMERELEVYRSLFSSTSDESSSRSFLDQEVVTRLLQTETQLSVERTLSRELGVQLEQKTGEVDTLNQQLEVQKFGYRRAQARVSALLNDFVSCCLEIPNVANDTNVKRCFEELLAKADNLSEFEVEIATAVRVVSQELPRSRFLHGTPEEDEIDWSGISKDQAVDKIIELQAKEKRLRRDAKHEIIEQMRKHKQAAMKGKDLEERLQKSDADKLLGEELLRDENNRLRSELERHHQTLGYRSSYATRVAESVRSFVDLVETQKLELQSERDRLRVDLSDLQQSHDELNRLNCQLEDDIKRISATALEDATATVKQDLDRLRSECSRLHKENKELVEHLEMVQDTGRRDREKSQSLVETVETLESKAQQYESEVKELRQINAFLTETKQQLETKIITLEKTLQHLLSERQPTAARQFSGSSLANQQRRMSEASYGDRELQQPTLISRSPSPPQSSSQRTDWQTLESLNAAVSLTGDVMTQSLPPAIGSYSQYRYPGSFGINQPGERSLRLAESSAIRPREGRGELHTTLAGSSYSRNVGRVPANEIGRSFLFSRNEASKTMIGSTTRDTMQCLRCGSRFSVANLDEYEKHIKSCYSDVNVQ